MSLFNYGLVEAALGIAWLLVPAEYKVSRFEAEPTAVDAVVVLSLIGIAVLRWFLANYRAGLVPYGKVYLNYWVIDWGPFGSNFELPEHLCTPFPHWVAVHPSKVEQTAKDVEQRLRAAGNSRFVEKQADKQMDIVVKRIYFRVGERANETAEQYKQLVVELLEKERLDFFTFIHNSEKIEETWIYENYLSLGYNGSAPE